jgi:hypothetical protein
MSIEDKIGEATLTLIQQVSSLATTSGHHDKAIDQLTVSTTQLVETTKGHEFVADVQRKRVEEAHEKLDTLLGIPKKVFLFIVLPAVVTLTGLIVTAIWNRI